MAGYHEIFEWVKGTNLRLVLSHMDDDSQDKFANAYIDAVSKEYPYNPIKKSIAIHKDFSSRI